MTILHICASFQRVRSHSGRKDRDREGDAHVAPSSTPCAMTGPGKNF